MMRKSVLFGFAFLLFSCTAGFIIEPQKGTVGLGEAVFPEPEPFVPDPIEVTGLRATQETYINEIHVTWNTVSAGVYYWRLFWFTSAAEAETERKEALSDGFYQTDEISVRAPVSPRLSVAADSYEHIFTYAADGSEIPLPSGQTFYYLLKGYDGASRITACSEIAVGKTAAVPYDVTASRNYQPQKPEDPAFITLMWKWDNPDSVFRVERAKAPFSSEQTWTDRGIVKPEFKDGFYTYIEEFSHDGGCSFGSEDNPDVKCSESCLIGAEFGYRIYAVTDGVESLPSQMVQGLTVKWGTPPAVTNFKATQGLYGRKIALSWDASADGNLQGYVLFFKTAANSEWESMRLSSDATGCDYETASFNIMQFYVAAENLLGTGSPSETESGYIIPQVKDTSGSLLEYESQINVTWTPVSVGEGEIVYNLYRSETTAGEGTLIAEDLTEASYTDNDETLRQGKVYYYSVEPRNTAAEPPTDGIGHKTAFRDTYGVTGSMPQPEFTVSTGESSIKLTLSNRPAYCYTTVNAERWVYTPSYTKKPSASKGTPSQPATWIQTLQFKNRWTRSKKESVAVEKSTDAVIVDSSSVFGYNDYTVYYGFDIPEISFSAHSEASVKKSGYRQISNEEFLINALRVIDFSQSYLTRIHEPGTGAAGFDSVSINGYNGWSSGNCGGAGGKCEDKKEAPNKGCFHYWAQLGMGEVTVPLMYNDFEAFDMIFNSIRTGHQTKVNLSANGTLTGYINITGLYSGKLTFNLTITDSVKAGGTYTVQQAGKAAENLSWNADEKYFNK